LCKTRPVEMGHNTGDDEISASLSILDLWGGYLMMIQPWKQSVHLIRRLGYLCYMTL